MLFLSLRNTILFLFNVSSQYLNLSLKKCQILLIQALVFSNTASHLRLMCIRQTYDGKGIPIMCSTTLLCFVNIVVDSLLSISIDQVSSIYYSSNKDANMYVESLDSIQDNDDIIKIVLFLRWLSPHFWETKTWSFLSLQPTYHTIFGNASLMILSIIGSLSILRRWMPLCDFIWALFPSRVLH